MLLIQYSKILEAQSSILWPLALKVEWSGVFQISRLCKAFLHMRNRGFLDVLPAVNFPTSYEYMQYDR